MNNIYNNIEYDKKKFRELCDIKYDYLPSIIPSVRRIIGIGDIHGDLNLAINFLKVGKVVKELSYNEYLKNSSISLKIPILENNNDFTNIYNNITNIMLYPNITNNIKNFRYLQWIGDDTFVVQVGDQIDRCRPGYDNDCTNKNTTFEDENSDLLIMELFDNLHKIAKQFNGAVYSLIGNHELLNFDGNFNYVSYEGMNDYKDISRYQSFNNMRNKFSCTRNAILIIGDYIFVHGGLATSLMSKYNVIEINNIIRTYIDNKFEKIKEQLKDRKNPDYNIIKNRLIEYYKIINSSSFSPLWYRKLANIEPDIKQTLKSINECKTYYDPIISHFKNNGLNINGLIIGHTPQFGVHGMGINTACNGGVIRIDIGASKAFDNIVNKKYDSLRKTQVIEIMNVNNQSVLNILHD